jgi:hypothetical protein
MLRDALSKHYGKLYVDHLIKQAEAALANPSVSPTWEISPEELYD